MLRQLLSITLAFIVCISLNVAADSKEPCQLPVLPVSNYNLLGSLKYFGDSGIAKIATVGDHFSLHCEQGALEVQPGSQIKFNSEAMPEEIYAANSSFVQQGVSTSAKAGAKIILSEVGYLLEVEDTEAFPYALRSQQQIKLAGELEFYEDGNLSSAEAASSGEVSIFGDSVSLAEGDGLHFTPYRTLIYQSALKRVKGDWTLSSSQGNLKLSLDYNSNGEIEIFLVRGDASVLHPDIGYKAMIQPLTAGRFYLPDSDVISFDLQGAIYKEVAEESVREEIPIPAVLTQSGKSLILNVNGSSLRFERDNLIDVAINRLFALGQLAVSLVLSLVLVFLIVLIFRAWIPALKNVEIKHDRRYTKNKRNAPMAEGPFIVLLFVGAAAIGITFFVYFSILGWLQISSPVEYFSFFFF